MSLILRSGGAKQVLAQGSVLPDADFHCPLMSLPLAFNTTLDGIPAPAPPRPDPVTQERWRARLGERTRPRIGLVWSGSVSHLNDRRRSVPLAEWVVHLPGEFHYVSLQKDVREADRRTLDALPQILDLSDELTDFADTAAAIECLDLVVSVDTSVAHLSATLGRQTWIVLPFNPDWRWLLKRRDSPWYRSVTLYRQEHPGDRQSVLTQLGADLQRFSQAVASTP